MKTLRLLTIALATISSLVLTSCGGEEEGGNLKADIISKWSYNDKSIQTSLPDAAKGIVNELISIFTSNYLGYIEGSTIDFKADNTLTITKGELLTNGTYTVDGKLITTLIDDGSLKCYGEVSGNKLTLSIDKALLIKMIESTPDLDLDIDLSLLKSNLVQFSIKLIFTKV